MKMIIKILIVTNGVHHNEKVKVRHRIKVGLNLNNNKDLKMKVKTYLSLPPMKGLKIRRQVMIPNLKVKIKKIQMTNHSRVRRIKMMVNRIFFVLRRMEDCMIRIQDNLYRKMIARIKIKKVSLLINKYLVVNRVKIKCKRERTPINKILRGKLINKTNHQISKDQN